MLVQPGVGTGVQKGRGCGWWRRQQPATAAVDRAAMAVVAEGGGSWRLRWLGSESSGGWGGKKMK